MRFLRLFFAPILSFIAYAGAVAATPVHVAYRGLDFLGDMVSLHFLRPLATSRFQHAMISHGAVALEFARRPMGAANLLTATECGMTRSVNGMLRGGPRRDRAAFGSVGLIA